MHLGKYSYALQLKAIHNFLSFIAQTVQPTEEEQPKVVAGVYRPPGMRTKMAMSGAIKGKAPEINSEIAFPSLHAAVQDSKRLILFSFSAVY